MKQRESKRVRYVSPLGNQRELYDCIYYICIYYMCNYICNYICYICIYLDIRYYILDVSGIYYGFYSLWLIIYYIWQLLLLIFIRVSIYYGLLVILIILWLIIINIWPLLWLVLIMINTWVHYD